MSDPWMLQRRLDEARVRLARAVAAAAVEERVEAAGTALVVHCRAPRGLWLALGVGHWWLGRARRKAAQRAAQRAAGYAPAVEVVWR